MRTLSTGSIPSEPSGFTLIEMLMVLFIFGIFTLTLTPRIKNIFSGGDIRLASRIIIGEIHYAREMAAFRHMDGTLLLDIDRNRIYHIAGKDQMERNPSAGISVPEGVSIADVVISPRGRFKEGTAVIQFFSNGCVEKSTIHLRNTRGDYYALDINPLTGRVSLNEE